MTTATDHDHGQAELGHTGDDHHYTSLGLDNMKLAFWCFLGSECFFFGTLLGTYMSTRGKSLTGPYPREVFDVLITSISTFLLLMSSLTMVLAVHYAKLHLRGKSIFFMLFTAALGGTFVAFQVYEFYHFYTYYNMTLQGNLFGSAFYVLTGFHKAHVVFGMIWLVSLCVMVWKNKVKGDLGTTVEVAGLYWHFVDIVWIVIFTLVYLLEYT